MSVAFDSDVTLTLQAAFGDNPYTASPTWTDISSDLRAFEIVRGRSNFLDVVQAGTARFTLNNNAGAYDPTYVSGANYPNVKPMVQIRLAAVHNSITYYLFRGFVQNWHQVYNSDVQATCLVEAVDGMAVLAELKSSSSNVQELSSVRIGNLLDDAGWPAGWRDIDTGIETCIAYNADCQRILGLLQQVEKTEAGLFFIAGDGDATFQAQDYRSGLSVSATFGDDGAELPYQDVQIDYNLDQLYNKVEVIPWAGLPSTDSDATSISTYGERLLTVYDTLQHTVAAADDHAADLLAKFKDPKVNISRLSYMPQRAPSTLWPRALGDDLSTKYTVKKRPPAGNTISQDVYLEGIRHFVSVNSKVWNTELTLSQWAS